MFYGWAVARPAVAPRPPTLPPGPMPLGHFWLPEPSLPSHPAQATPPPKPPPFGGLTPAPASGPAGGQPLLLPAHGGKSCYGPARPAPPAMKKQNPQADCAM